MTILVMGNGDEERNAPFHHYHPSPFFITIIHYFVAKE